MSRNRSLREPKPFSDATRPIWALVSGYPKAKRDKRALAMLHHQVFVDESGKGQDVFVSAGYLSTVERWVAFSDAWQKVLDTEPRIDYLKMSDAGAIPPKGEFAGFTEEQVVCKIKALKHVIDKYVILGVTAAVSAADFRELLRGKISPVFKSPDWFAHTNVMGRIMRRKNMARAEVDFIFDDMPDENIADLRRHWADMKVLARKYGLRGNLEYGTEPIRKDEKKVLPLQAADMLSWLIQNPLTGNWHGADRCLAHRFRIPEPYTDMLVWNRDRLEGYLAGMESRNGGEYEWETKQTRKTINKQFMPPPDDA